MKINVNKYAKSKRNILNQLKDTYKLGERGVNLLVLELQRVEEGIKKRTLKSY